MLATESSPLSPRTLHAQRALVGRVLASETFSQSKRLSSLLAYLCEMTFAGRAEELNEQSVGEAVFGRSRDYNTMIDGIVRTQASRLRTRLNVYFGGEGSTEPVRITIPRGIYAPTFEPNLEPRLATVPQLPMEPDLSVSSSVTSIDLPVHAEPAPQVPAQSRTPLLHSLPLAWSVAGCAFLVLLALAVMKVIRPQHTFASPPENPIWAQIFTPGQAVLLVPGDSSLVIYQGITERNLTLDEYISGAYRDFHPNPAVLMDDASATNIASRRYTSIVDLETAAGLGRIAHERGATLNIRYPRELRPNDLKQGTLIMVGAAEADPWITLVERGMNFNFYYDRTKHIMSVINRVPRGNELSHWDSISTDSQHRVYSVVAWLPNLSGDGHILLIEGSTMAGTECAWDFVNDDMRLNPFLHSIRRSDGTLPPFELLLDASNIAGSASQSNILAYRTH